MSSSDVPRRLNDIVTNAERIFRYVGNRDEAQFAADVMIQDATERCLERIAEAIVKIGPERMAAIVPDLPFERVRGLGNMLRHAYDDIDLIILFRLIRDDLPVVVTAAKAALSNDGH